MLNILHSWSQLPSITQYYEVAMKGINMHGKKPTSVLYPNVHIFVNDPLSHLTRLLLVQIMDQRQQWQKQVVASSHLGLF